jgi:hypothetical protein
VMQLVVQHSLQIAKLQHHVASLQSTLDSMEEFIALQQRRSWDEEEDDSVFSLSSKRPRSPEMIDLMDADDHALSPAENATSSSQPDLLASSAPILSTTRFKRSRLGDPKPASTTNTQAHLRS